MRLIARELGGLDDLVTRRWNTRRSTVVLIVLVLLAAKTAVDYRLLKNAGLPQSIQEASESEYVATLFKSFNATMDAASKALSSLPDDSAPDAATSKYAYAFVIGGCNPEQPSYQGFIYNIMVVAKLLKQFGSTADVVAMIQMSNKSPATELPEHEQRVLHGLGVKIHYIQKAEYESFYDTVLHKFNILELTQYRRVLLLDGDVVPIGNLDYLFELSDGENAILKENVVVTGPWEPSNGGFFMLEPGEGRRELVDEVIRNREAHADRENGMDGHMFNVVLGWGHKIDPPDEWVARQARGRNWTFHFAFSDQGLLYYYTKYLQKSVSIIHFENVENWAADSSGVVHKEASFEKPFLNYSQPVLHDSGACRKFMCDFVHFSGTAKPWMSKSGPQKSLTEETKLASANNLWWWTLIDVNAEFSMGLNFTHWVTPGRPPLGLYATYRDMDARITARQEHKIHD